MSTPILCPACNHPLSGPAHRCGAPVSRAESRSSETRWRALEAWPGLDSLMAAQEAADAYWYLARDDHGRLSELAESWSAPDSPVRRLLAAKLNRGLVCDSADLPREVVAMGAQVEFRLRGDLETGTLAYPDRASRSANAISIAGPIGVLLLGMLAGRTWRSKTPDGTPLDLAISKVEQLAAARSPGGSETPGRKLAS